MGFQSGGRFRNEIKLEKGYENRKWGIGRFGEKKGGVFPRGKGDTKITFISVHDRTTCHEYIVPVVNRHIVVNGRVQ